MAKHDEMTPYAFNSHMKAYMKKLLTVPLKADTDEFLKSHGLDGPTALKILLKRGDPSDKNSAVLIKKVLIKDNGTDENGNRLKDTFSIKYRVPRKGFEKKMRNLYISLFESNIVDGCPINEGAWGYGILDNDAALDYQSDTTKAYLYKVIKDVKNAGDADSRWARIGVLVDFLKKYKSDELQITKEYGKAIDFAKKVLKELYNDDDFVSKWDDAAKMRSSLKKAFNDVSALRYNEDIMLADDNDAPIPMNRGEVERGPVPNDGKLMEDDEVLEATGCDGSSGQFVTPLFGGPIKRKTMYITQEQADYIRKRLNEEEGNCPVQNTKVGAFGYTAPIGDGKNNKGNDFYKEANDHQNMMAKSWKGSMEEEKSPIHIKEKNKGKFGDTAKEHGKSVQGFASQVLANKENYSPTMVKMANFAKNASKWHKK